MRLFKNAKAVLAIIVLMLGSTICFAGALCPPDECNPRNGCMTGCAPAQVICSRLSVSQCAGKQMGEACRWTVGTDSGSDVCWPSSSDQVDQCSCG